MTGTKLLLGAPLGRGAGSARSGTVEKGKKKKDGKGNAREKSSVWGGTGLLKPQARQIPEREVMVPHGKQARCLKAIPSLRVWQKDKSFRGWSPAAKGWRSAEKIKKNARDRSGPMDVQTKSKSALPGASRRKDNSPGGKAKYMGLYRTKVRESPVN